MLKDLSVSEFIAKTASGEPIPGGGSVSALSGALATALGAMVAGLTIGKKKYAIVEESMKIIADALAGTGRVLLDMVDLDSEAYNRVFQAYKLPKDTDDEKTARKAAIQDALKDAANVPFTVASLVESQMALLENVAVNGNSNACTDAYVAALCARTAILGACANVRINLLSISDTDYVEKMTAQVEALETAANAFEAAARTRLMAAMQ